MDVVLPEPYTNWEKHLINKRWLPNAPNQEDSLELSNLINKNGEEPLNQIFLLHHDPISYICKNKSLNIERYQDTGDSFILLYEKVDNGEWRKVDIMQNEMPIFAAKDVFDIYKLIPPNIFPRFEDMSRAVYKNANYLYKPHIFKPPYNIHVNSINQSGVLDEKPEIRFTPPNFNSLHKSNADSYPLNSEHIADEYKVGIYELKPPNLKSLVPKLTPENATFNAIEDDQLGGKRRAKKRRRSTRKSRRRSTRKSRRRSTRKSRRRSRK